MALGKNTSRDCCFSKNNTGNVEKVPKTMFYLVEDICPVAVGVLPLLCSILSLAGTNFDYNFIANLYWGAMETDRRGAVG